MGLIEPSLLDRTGQDGPWFRTVAHDVYQSSRGAEDILPTYVPSRTTSKLAGRQAGVCEMETTKRHPAIPNCSNQASRMQLQPSTGHHSGESQLAVLNHPPTHPPAPRLSLSLTLCLSLFLSSLLLSLFFFPLPLFFPPPSFSLFFSFSLSLSPFPLSLTLNSFL